MTHKKFKVQQFIKIINIYFWEQNYTTLSKKKKENAFELDVGGKILDALGFK